jgi:hypothetical protein
MEHEIVDDFMSAQILFNTQPSIYSTTIEILTREQSIGTEVPTLLQNKNEFCQVYSKNLLNNGQRLMKQH